MCSKHTNRVLLRMKLLLWRNQQQEKLKKAGLDFEICIFLHNLCEWYLSFCKNKQICAIIVLSICKYIERSLCVLTNLCQKLFTLFPPQRILSSTELNVHKRHVRKKKLYIKNDYGPKRTQKYQMAICGACNAAYYYMNVLVILL